MFLSFWILDFFAQSLSLLEPNDPKLMLSWLLTFRMLWVALFFMMIFPVYRLFKIFLYERGRPTSLKSRRGHSQVRVLAVLGSGGHTTEMLRIVKILDDEFMPLSFVYAETDKHSLDQVKEVIEKPYSIRTIPRARFVNLRLNKYGGEMTIISPGSFRVSWQNDCYSTSRVKNWEIDERPL